MAKTLRPVVKIEDGVEESQAEVGRQEEADAGRAVQRRRVGEGGDAALDEAQLLRANMEAQAQAIEGMERARVLGEELQRARAREAELAAELKIHVDAQSKLQDVIHAKDTVIQSKDALLQAKDTIIQSKDREISLLLQGHASELRLLQADVARRSAERAAAGAARLPAPAPAAQGDAAAQGEALFQEGQRLYGEQRFSEAAERWGRAALLQHAPSHAHLSDVLILGKPGVDVDKRRALKLAKAGVALGCAHSKGALGRCYIWGCGVAADEARGLALGRESEAAGSCFGQYVVGLCYRFGWGGVAQDYTEAVPLFRLAAAQGHAHAQFNLGVMFECGQGVAQDRAEAIRLYRLAIAQGHASAHAGLMRLGA
jgi:tetratricopeptide (TPR) repeat protein